MNNLWCLLVVISVFLLLTCSEVSNSSVLSDEVHGRLTIFPEGERARFEAHKTLLLTCQGVGVEPGYFSDFQWYNRNGERIYGDQRIFLKRSQGSLSLIINDPEIGDGGNYRCTAMYQNTKLLDASIEIIVFKSITWDDCPEDQYLIKGLDNQKIVCKVSSQPTSKISWEKDSVDLDKQKYSIVNDGVIIKGAVANETTGLYKITASILEHGILRDRNIRVQVLVRPTITEFEQSREVVEGERTTINCRANAVPSPFYSFIDNRRRNLTLESGYTVDSVRGDLVIGSVKRDTESQFISCIARNAAGETSKKMDLTVLTKPVVFELNNATFIEDTSKEWRCRVRANPEPEIKMVKIHSEQDSISKEPLPEIASRFTFTRTKLGIDEYQLTMKINGVRREDDGLYYCRASNKAGITETVGHIQVEYPPDLRLTNTNVKTWSSNPVNLTCIAEAIPNATISWRFGNDDIRYLQTDAYTFYDGNGISHLMVRPNVGRYVYGSYFCIAENLRGKKAIEIKLSEAYPPSSPNVKIIKARPTSIEMELTDVASDLPVQKFQVKYWRDSEADSEKVHTWPASGSVYRLENLTPSTRYRLTFAAQNEVGIGAWTAYRTEITPDESRPEKARFLFDGDFESKQIAIDGYVKSNFGDSFTVRWNQAEDNGRVITHYNLKYQKAHKTQDGYIINGEAYPEIRVNARDSHQSTLRNLSPNTFYKIELYAINSLGTSDPSELIFKTSATPSSSSSWGQDMEYDPSYRSMGTALISVAISLIIILILMDIIFYIRCKVGVLYFIKNFIWPETSVNSRKKSNDFHPGAERFNHLRYQAVVDGEKDRKETITCE